MRALELALDQIWAIQPEMLETILSIAARENESIEAVEKALGRKLDNTRTVSHRNGVAIIPVEGPIVRYASSFGAISGGVSVETLGKDFNAALESREINSILLSIDSPGGAVSGINELAQMIYDARGKKPIHAYTGNLMASAGYWLGSAADEIIAAETASLGSIGVLSAIRTYSKRPGVKEYEFVSSQSPRKRLDLDTDDGQAAIQERVDAIAEIFIGAVARNRSVSPETVQRDFGKGWVLMGEKAVEMGMADRVGSFESALENLANLAGTGRQYVTINANKGADAMTLEQLIAKHPELVDQIKATATADALAEAKAGMPDVDAIKKQAREEGATAERERIKDVAAVAIPGHKELIENAMFDGKSTGGDVAKAVLIAEKKQREAAGEHAKEERTGAVAETSGEAADTEHADEEHADADAPKFEDLSAESQAEKLWADNAEFEGEKVQTTFGDAENFKAYYKNRERIR